jgi:hypothetical protein
MNTKQIKCGANRHLKKPEVIEEICPKFGRK